MQGATLHCILSNKDRYISYLFLGGIISIKMEVGVVFLGNFMSSGCWLGSFYGCRKFEKLLAK
jgi:hypothetical protein